MLIKHFIIIILFFNYYYKRVLVWCHAVIKLWEHLLTTRSIWKMLGPFATTSRLTPIHQMSPLYCHTRPAHRCPRRQRRQRQRVTEGTTMAPWNGPKNKIDSIMQVNRNQMYGWKAVSSVVPCSQTTMAMHLPREWTISVIAGWSHCVFSVWWLSDISQQFPLAKRVKVWHHCFHSICTNK